MQFDTTVSLGNILSVLSVIGALLIASSRIIGKINKLQWKMSLIWKWYAKEHGIDSADDE